MLPGGPRRQRWILDPRSRPVAPGQSPQHHRLQHEGKLLFVISAALVSLLPSFSLNWLSPLFFKVANVDEARRSVSVHLFTDKNFHDPTRSLNHQMAQSSLLKRQPDVFLTSHRFPSQPPPARPASQPTRLLR